MYLSGLNAKGYILPSAHQLAKRHYSEACWWQHHSMGMCLSSRDGEN